MIGTPRRKVNTFHYFPAGNISSFLDLCPDRHPVCPRKTHKAKRLFLCISYKFKKFSEKLLQTLACCGIVGLAK